MRKDVTYVDYSEFEAIVRDLNLETKENAGFLQVKLGNGYHVYVAKTKRVGRVDLQFVPPGAGYEDLGEFRFGRIVAQLDFSQDEESILENFARALVHGSGLPTWVAPKREGKKAAAEPTPEEMEERATRRRLIVERALASSDGQ